MELSTLLSALVQGAETGVLTQVASGNSGANTGAQAGFSLTGQPGSTATSQPGAGQSGLTVAGQPGLSLSSQPGLTVAGQSELSLSGQTGASLSDQVGTGLAAQAQTSSGGSVAQATIAIPVQQGLKSTNLPVVSELADVYHGSEAPASPSLLSQSGVGAYIHLLNAFASQQADDKSSSVLSNNLGSASASLKSAYNEAVATLSPELQQKDWSFSMSDGVLVFSAGKDELSAQDLADLQKAFTGANVELAAREVATAITSMQTLRQSGADPSSLAWSGIEADESNFGEVVDLRSYVTNTVPGGNYHPNTPAATPPPQIPILLGGMDLRDLVSARPNFFHADGSVVTDTPDTEDEAAEVTEEATTLQGQCACGEVRFSVENTFEYAFYCHCSRCRLRTGSVFAATAGIEVDKVKVTAGNDHLLIEGECADGYGARCSRCHAFLFAVVRERKYMHVSLGALEGSPTRLPDHHIHVASKAPWFQITDDLPQYDELPPGDASGA
jgi:hypothetical protein